MSSETDQLAALAVGIFLAMIVVFSVVVVVRFIFGGVVHY